jgi:D-glycero-alpha-D-manno-heptose-7-phosphate kinase
MVHTSDLPARSGIGSSSSFTVGFLNSLYALTGQMVSKRKLALDSIHVEHNLIKENVGSQDQVAAAFGGFNKIVFGKEERIIVQPVTVSQEKLDLLQDHLMLFFTGLSRTASDIAKDQIEKISSRKNDLRIMRDMVDEGINILNSKTDSFDSFGKLLNEAWKIKRGLSRVITNSTIDEIYNTAISAGALGGKLLGAGSGGFIIFYVPLEKKWKVRKMLEGLVYVPFKFETLGSQVILYTVQDLPSLSIREYQHSYSDVRKKDAALEQIWQSSESENDH